MSSSEEIDEEIEQEKKKQEELKAKNKETEKKINDQHKNMGGVHMSGAHAAQTQKNRRKLESQLQLVRIIRTVEHTNTSSIILQYQL